MDWKSLLFSFRGRINRGKYWLVILINMIVTMVAVVLTALFSDAPLGGGSPGPVILVMFLVLGVFSLWTGFASAIKRLHDRNKSGWWLLLFGVLPMAISTVAQIIGGVALALGLVALAIYIWGFVEIACLKGTDGPNQYGPDPLPAEPD